MKKYWKYAFVFGIIKKAVILIFLFSNYSFGQAEWQYFEGNDPFDGKIKIVTAYGENSRAAEPPILMMKLQNDEFKIYFTNVADLDYSDDCEKMGIIYSYGNTKDIKRVPSIEPFSYGKNVAISVKSIFDIELFLAFLEDLKKHSKLYFRVNCDGYRENQFELSLKGSTKALDQIGIEKVLRKKLDEYNKQ